MLDGNQAVRAADHSRTAELTMGYLRAIFKAMATIQLDLTGLKCPLPALRTRKALKSVEQGDRVEVYCTDPLSVIDIPSLVRETGDRVELIDRTDGRIMFVIEKMVGSQA